MEAKFPIGAVFAVTVIENGKFIIISDKFKPPPKLFKCLGGRVERGETPLQAIVREFEEEANYKVAPELFNELIVIDVEDTKHPHSILFYSLEMPNVSLEDLKPGYEIKDMLALNQQSLEEILCYQEVLPNHAEGLTEYIKSVRA